jgi:hypothetical protein
MANIKSSLHSKVVFFLTMLLFQTNFSFAQKTHVFQGPKLVTSSEVQISKSLPKLMKELAEDFPFEIPYLSNVMDTSFVLINGSAQASFYKANAVVNLADGTRIENISWHTNRRTNSADAIFFVKGSCVTHKTIAELLGGLTLISLPGNPFNFTNPTYIPDFIYAIKIDRGIATVFFSEKSLCLTRFEFHSQLGKYDLKKLAEADMRTPEEIKKKRAPKP